MIEISGVYKKFDDEEVLKGVNLKIGSGQTFALIGGSGKGKSVLLKHIVGLVKPDRGTILIDGQDTSRLRGQKLKKLKDRLGIVFQFGALFDSLSVYENVAFPLGEKTKLTPPQIRERVMKELTDLGIEGDRDKYPAQLSGGMKKRAALARCLALDPDIIFFDEPTTGLDPVIAASIYKMIRKLQENRRLTALIVSHEIPGIFRIVDRVAMLHDGKIISVGTPEEIQTTSNPVVQKFLNGELE